jgi:hypothetical protein
MNVTGPIRALIITDPEAFALVGDRVYPVLIPKSATFPAVGIQVVSNLPSDTKSGVSGVDIIRVQVDSYAETYVSAQATDEAVRGAIDKYYGQVNVTGADLAASGVNCYIGGVRYETTQDIFEDQSEIFRISSDYIVRLHR